MKSRSSSGNQASSAVSPARQLVPIQRRFWPPAACGVLILAGLVGWLLRPSPHQLDQNSQSLQQLLDDDLARGSPAPSRTTSSQAPKSVVPKVPPGADSMVPLAIRVGLMSQSPVTAFRPGRDVRCRDRGLGGSRTAAEAHDRCFQPSGDSLFRWPRSDQPAALSGGNITAQRPAGMAPRHLSGSGNLCGLSRRCRNAQPMAQGGLEGTSCCCTLLCPGAPGATCNHDLPPG